ncbi:MAG: nucleotidyl transferase AbiEii/AbiGii toxin family protein [Anaerolineae bacterium]|nr:nucleotidyl transferase AbiEii/AbiGii toxin family protein [Anaerolineae bacterium]
MYRNALLPSTAQVIQKIRGAAFLESFYLSGGTALALYLGHRESEDLDFFTYDTFDPQHVQSEVNKLGQLESVEIADGTLNAFLDTVKLQFLHYPYPLLQPKNDWEGLSISSIVDIACTKIITISMRGSKKDFVDLYFLLKHYSLEELFDKVDQKYQGVNYNRVHLAKSLVYFEDAEGQPMPRMLQRVQWEEVKTTITQAVKETFLFRYELGF